MSYGNMDEEIKKYQQFYKQSETTLNKLSSLFKEIGKNGVKFIEKIQKSFDSFISELKKEDNSTTMNTTLINICTEFNIFFTKKKEGFSSIDKKIGDKISVYEKEYKDKYKENINKMLKLSNKINDSKSLLDKNKNEYFNSCKEILDLEKKIDPKKMDDEILKKMTEERIKLKQISESKKIIYSKEVENFNKMLDNNETEYLAIKAYFKNDQNDKILFYIEIINLINSVCKVQGEVLTNALTKMNKYKEDINIRRDLKLFEQDFNFINNATKKRFIEEQFLNYELRKRSGSGKDNTPNEEQKLGVQDSKYIKALQILELGNDEFIDYSTLNENDIMLDKFITNLIDSDKKINDEEYLYMGQFYRININNTKRFMYLLVNHFCTKKLIQIYSIDNFKYLNDILSEIIISSKNTNENFELLFLIMFIANKTVYYNEKTNQVENYLCHELSKNKLFSEFDFWMELLKERVELVAQVEINQEIQKRKDSIGKEDNNTIINTAIGKIGKFFKRGGNNKVLEKEILFNQMFQKKSPKICDKVLEEYLKQFINYNFYGNNAIKLIDQLGSTFALPNENRNYFKKVIKTNEIIKNSMKGIKNICNDNNYDKFYFTYKGNKSFKGIEDKKLVGLIFSLRFLDIKDIPKILCLNKSLKEKLDKKIYKNILTKYFNKLDSKTHLSIWKILLKFSDIKKKYDYNQILEEVNKSPESVKNIDIIKLDIIRTSFETEEESKRIKIGNMLKAISKELPSLNYCQGMNQIAAFLLDVCDYNEEEAFYIFLSLMIDSVYSSLFKNELENLNILFYQFERILSHTSPEIYSYLKDNKITPGFFVSPWFITLFTDAFDDKKNSNNKKIIMKIFDLFIFEGWKAIIKIGISLLKYNENKILQTPVEELLNFLTNDIIKSKFFDKNNLDSVLKSDFEIKISKKTLEEINEQYKIRKSLPALE